jgi:hypothetical protein
MLRYDYLSPPRLGAVPRALPAGVGAGPVEVLCGPFVCRLRVWTDAAWAGLAPHERPPEAEYFPGLGWVGAVPVGGLN